MTYQAQCAQEVHLVTILIWETVIKRIAQEIFAFYDSLYAFNRTTITRDVCQILELARVADESIL